MRRGGTIADIQFDSDEDDESLYEPSESSDDDDDDNEDDTDADGDDDDGDRSAPADGSKRAPQHESGAHKTKSSLNPKQAPRPRKEDSKQRDEEERKPVGLAKTTNSNAAVSNTKKPPKVLATCAPRSKAVIAEPAPRPVSSASEHRNRHSMSSEPPEQRLRLMTVVPASKQHRRV